MARMHSRKKGKSGPTKPVEKKVPSWLSYKPKEVELLVIKYAKEGKKPSQIGLTLRDIHGIPDVKLLTKKNVTEILKEKKMGLALPEDLKALILKSLNLRKHMEANKHDMPGKRGLQLTDSKINRLAKYYKRVKVLPQEWKFDPRQPQTYLE